MSLKTWKKEFYPPIGECIGSEVEAIEHELTKWYGFLKKNLKKHKVSYYTVFDETTACALCKVYHYGCSDCPLDHFICGGFYNSPYSQAYEPFYNPIPMMDVLAIFLHDALVKEGVEILP